MSPASLRERGRPVWRLQVCAPPPQIYGVLCLLLLLIGLAAAASSGSRPALLAFVTYTPLHGTKHAQQWRVLNNGASLCSSVNPLKASPGRPAWTLNATLRQPLSDRKGNDKRCTPSSQSLRLADSEDGSSELVARMSRCPSCRSAAASKSRSEAIQDALGMLAAG